MGAHLIAAEAAPTIFFTALNDKIIESINSEGFYTLADGAKSYKVTICTRSQDLAPLFYYQ